MSNHLSGKNLTFPADDARLDLTDVFAFRSPADPGRTVLIMDSNTFATGRNSTPTPSTNFTWTPMGTTSRRSPSASCSPIQRTVIRRPRSTGPQVPAPASPKLAARCSSTQPR